ncbi:CPBP family glutamic-type intramembrane protease [Natrinema salaciae]|uniref:CAAX protease self-immunity n=1 Tax=Natrinema salaciae TaxID=1186196 RepID=A0A1H9FW98_9EURY|nr:CPBP family glutamic-type intramembrane protease [Natrinema salaciae]SEQ41738.1 CAAX protease self-immunity [Natrinema salaciae]
MDTHAHENRESDGASSLGITGRRFGVLFAVGFLGIIALAATTPSQLETLPEAPDVPTAILVAAALVQSSILLAIAVLVGLYTAPRLGLRSHLLERVSAGTPIGSRLRAELPIAAGLGAAAGVAIVLAEAVFAPAAPAGAGGSDATVGAVLASVPVRFLYGGLTEELLLRWGVMSLVAFGLWRTVGRGTDAPSARLMATAVVVAAVVFGIGHLPAAASLYGGLSADVVAWIVAGNAIGGLAFGWLFWQRSLEAAMIGHVFAHVVFVALSLVIVVV